MIKFTKIIILATILSLIFINNTLTHTTIITAFNNQTHNKNPYTGEISYLSFNTLIAFPEKAFNTNNNNRSLFDETKLTPPEFKKILNELYLNNYILVDIFDIFDRQTYQQKTLYIPVNKKPIILTFNNVTYTSNYQNQGEIDKIIVDRNNQIATYTTKQSIQDRIQYDNEFVVILEKFIKENPEFSHNNARGIIFLSGENGILGYNTNHKNASSKHESKRAIEVVYKLKSLGWRFGSNNYTYKDDNTKSNLDFAKELSMWNKEVKTIIGDTPLYLYPLGEEILNHEKKELLIGNGFHIFFNNSSNNTTETYGDIIYIPVQEINGKSLRENQQTLNQFFSCKNVYDNNLRPVKFTES